jgi:hypothetical protein
MNSNLFAFSIAAQITEEESKSLTHESTYDEQSQVATWSYEADHKGEGVIRDSRPTYASFSGTLSYVGGPGVYGKDDTSQYDT